jgi:hypothetical protein
MAFLVLQAYLRLIQFDSYLAREDFEALYNKVRTSRLGRSRRHSIQSNGSVRRWIWRAFGTGKKRCACSGRRPRPVFSRDMESQLNSSSARSRCHSRPTLGSKWMAVS